MSVLHSISELIGQTPLLQLHKLETGPCSLFLKLENQNPGGSIKDRVALSMINEAERLGHLQPGGTIIEATAGNTGLGLALIAAQKGYSLILVVPDKMSREKIFHLRALGAKVVLTRSDVNKGHPAYYQDYARRLAQETPGAFYIDQFNNEANPLAHFSTTAPEIYAQLDGDIDAIVVGVGSGGTLGDCRHGLPNTRRKPNLSSPTRQVPFWPIRLKPGNTVSPAPGWSKASVRILSHRWRISTACIRPTGLPMLKRLPPRELCYKPKACWPVLQPVRCSAPRCVIARRRPPPNAW
jgi:hypothetical protein